MWPEPAALKKKISAYSKKIEALSTKLDFFFLYVDKINTEKFNLRTKMQFLKKYRYQIFYIVN